MDKRLDKIKFIAEKTTFLVAQNEEKTKKVEKLTSEVSSLQEKLNLLTREIQIVKNENEELKMATPIVEATEKKVSQKEIDKMITEIDECLALLNI